MKASEITLWHGKFKPTDWPEGALDKMNANVLTDLVFPLRDQSGIPMWPSALYAAHVRDSGNSQHSTERNGLSDATDMHVKTYQQMVTVAMHAAINPSVGGTGIYFNTNTPMVHVDRFATRGKKLEWLVTSNGDYIYRQNDPVKYAHTLSTELAKVGV